MSTRTPLRLGFPVFVAAFLAALFMSATALAGGALTIKTPEVTENNGTWHIRVRIDMPHAPAMMHIPMRFTFSKEAVDERAIMSKGADPVHHRMVLDVPPKNIQSLDVDFADASGRVFKSTYFEFDVERANGFFEAGEYLVSLSGPDGDVGGAQKLVLHGDNPPVYRGAMDFTSDSSSKGPKKQNGPNIQAVSSGLDGGTQVASNDTAAAGVSNGDVAAEGSGGDMVPSSAFSKTPEEEAVQDHPKGCGCVAVGAGVAPLAGLSAMLGILGASVIAARRRKGRN